MFEHKVSNTVKNNSCLCLDLTPKINVLEVKTLGENIKTGFGRISCTI